MAKRKSKKKSVTKIIFLVLVTLIAIGLLIFIREKTKYNNIFFNQTVINDVDCSLLTIEESIEAIQNKEEQYTLKILFKDNEVEYISGKEIDFTVNNLKQELEEIKNSQRKSLYFKGETYNLKDFTYNKENLKNILLNKRQLQKDYMDERTQITYGFNSNTKLFEIDKQNVYYLDFNNVFETITEAIENQITEVSLKDLYLTVDNNSTLEQLNSFIDSKITYQLPSGENLVLDANTLYNWLIQDDNGNYLKDEAIWNQNIEDFVTNQLSSLVDTINQPKEFKPTGKDYTVFVEGGDYGYQLDIETEISKLKEELDSNTIISREPCYKKVEVSKENYGLGNSYIEIDLTRQKVWAYVNGTLQIEADCVTGCINKGHETPTGIFTLTYKEQNKTLRGRMLSNGSYEYESPVSYWMPFNGGIGLHDASWRSSFGGNIYISNGSHGCINLPLWAASEIYKIINYDMPIIVYKS